MAKLQMTCYSNMYNHIQTAEFYIILIERWSNLLR